ncbi:phosphoenolpyruvate carboxylase [Escherichia coli]
MVCQKSPSAACRCTPGRFWKPTCCHHLSRKRAGVALWMNCQSSPAISTVATYVKNKDFVPYFRSATPEQELGKLPLGSRPAKRRPTGGVESLRAIPWIFARRKTV